MNSLSGHVMTLANSIIGVSVLAMPYCFKQCGIVLSILMLLISSIISRLACHFLMKSAIIARRKTFEFLAFHIFGSMGKFAIEIGIIGFLLGTCIAFFVVMGDLAPEIIGEITGIYSTSTMRTSILMALALFTVLPLGLLRNVDSLNGVSRATIGFYCCLVLSVVFEAAPHIFMGDWFKRVNFWRPEGILQCLPIFSMALFCQTQLFEIYQAVQNATLEKMNDLVRVAVNICTCVYIFVGMFGYIAFANKSFSGNVLLNFSPSLMTSVMKIGFILSVAFSFPLVIFPCRASLYSLLYKEGYTLHEGVSNYIPEGKFKALTMFIVFISLIIGIMIPNIELVLGLVGSTIGVMICVLFPVTCFIRISPKNTNERILAQIMLCVGIFVMVLGTYKNLYTLDKLEVNAVTIIIPKNVEQLEQISVKQVNFINQLPSTTKMLEIKTEKIVGKVTDNVKEVRHEPPQPIEPIDEEVKNSKKSDSDSTKMADFDKSQDPPDIKTVDKPQNETKVEEVDIEAINKEDNEEALQLLQAKEKVKEDNQALLDTIQKQHEVQKEIVEQQKKLIEVIQEQQKKSDNKDVDKVNEEKLKAVKQIESIALKAIEEISGKKDKDKLINTETSATEDKIIVSDKKLENLENKIKDTVKETKKVINEIKKKSDKYLGSNHDTAKLSVSKQLENEVIDHQDTVLQGKIVKQKLQTSRLMNEKQPKIVNKDINKPAKPANVDAEQLVEKDIKNNENKDHQIIYNRNNENQVLENKIQPINSSTNITAPLFLKLGKAEVEISNDKISKKFVHLPLVSQMTQNRSDNTIDKSKILMNPPIQNNEEINPLAADNQGNKDDLQAMRRDILAVSTK